MVNGALAAPCVHAGGLEPVGPVHFAGSEHSAVWNGCMEGAVRSGEEVAGDVLAALDRP